MEGFTIEPGNPEEASVAVMLRSSEEHAHSLYPIESIHMLAVAQLTSSAVRFLIARDNENGNALGCGAIVLQPGLCAELKRMFVASTVRRRGVGAAILKALESTARAEGVCTIRLETGPNQPEAIALYRRFGYCDRGPFGEYRQDPLSVFMEKRIDD